MQDGEQVSEIEDDAYLPDELDDIDKQRVRENSLKENISRRALFTRKLSLPSLSSKTLPLNRDQANYPTTRVPETHSES